MTHYFRLTITDDTGAKLAAHGTAVRLVPPEAMPTPTQREAHTPGPGRLEFSGRGFLSLTWPDMRPPMLVQVEGLSATLLGEARCVHVFEDEILINLIGLDEPMTHDPVRVPDLTDEEIVALMRERAAEPPQRYRVGDDPTVHEWPNTWTPALVGMLAAKLPRLSPERRKRLVAGLMLKDRAVAGLEPLLEQSRGAK